MWQRALNGGGGGGQYQRGQITLPADGTDTTVNLGFTPSKVVVVDTASTGTPYVGMAIKTSDVDVLMARLAPNYSDNFSISSSSGITIISNGFKVRGANTYWKGTAYYIAIE